MRSIYSILLSLFTLGALAQEASFKAGLKNALDLSVVEQAKDVYFNKIMSLIREVDLPDIYLNDGKDYMIGNSFVLHETPSDVKFYTDPATNSVYFEVSDFTGEFYCDHFRFKKTIFVAKGRIEVDLRKILIRVGVTFSTQTLADGRVVPFIDMIGVKVDIDRRDIMIHIHGNVWSDFAAFFEPIFKGIIIDKIQDSTEDAINTLVPKISNGIMAKLDGYFPVPLVKNWVVDWETPEAAQVTDNSFSIGVKGLMFDREFGEEEPQVAIPDMPAYNATRTEKYQAYVSSYSIDGFFSSLIEVNQGIHGYVTPDMLPEKLPTLTTGLLEVLLPGISDYYGPDQLVDVQFNVTSLGDFGVSQANTLMSGVMSIDLKFWVHTQEETKEMACELSLHDADFKFTAAVQQMNVTLSLSQFNVDSLDVVSDTFGRLSALTVKLKINNGFRFGQPFINHVLSKHQIMIPSNIFGIFALQDLVLDYYNDYIYAGATPIFLDPSQKLDEFVEVYTI